MNLFGVMQVSGSAMEAERVRAEVVAANMANAETTRTAEGGPYRREEVVFASEASAPGFLHHFSAIATAGSASAGSEEEMGGVRVAAVIADQQPPLRRFDPGSPDADGDGYVSYPDINPATEMVDLMGATRAYGMNSSAVQAEKGMVSSALDILK